MLEGVYVREEQSGDIEKPARRGPAPDHHGSPKADVDAWGDIALKDVSAAKPNEESGEHGNALPCVAISDTARASL